ncbi:MAG: hypothetical protein IIX68_01200, partial [Clostridia bacterium]|nr:hypothetical protein [Clostridia bacterium]
ALLGKAVLYMRQFRVRPVMTTSIRFRIRFRASGTTGIIPNKPQLVNRFCEKSEKSFWQGMEGGFSPLAFRFPMTSK